MGQIYHDNALGEGGGASTQYKIVKRAWWRYLNACVSI